MTVPRALQALVALPTLVVGWLGEWDGSVTPELAGERRQDGFLSGPDRWSRARRIAETHPDIFIEEGASFGRLDLPEEKTDTNEVSTHCAPLKNRGTHFTVQVGVGTPAQNFEVVADTGSSFVIVPSCMCVKLGRCASKDGCFQGTNKSSTFSMVKVKKKLNEKVKKNAVPMAVVTFGTGTIEAAIAQDVVDVGRVKANMKNGLLLMVNKVLRMKGPFSGILGLGLPGSHLPKGHGGKSGPAQAGKKGPLLLDIKPPSFNVDTQRSQSDRPGAEPPKPHFNMGKGFLEAAHVRRFSMCFNDGADGVLRLHTPKAKHSLESIGKMHWGLDFRGISVGTASAGSALFCKGRRRKGQDSACGAIPDSGTTVMTGPKDHVVTLFQTLCDKWKRCKKAFAKAQADFKKGPKKGPKKDSKHIERKFVQGSTEVDLADVSAQTFVGEFGASSEGGNQTEAQFLSNVNPRFPRGGPSVSVMRIPFGVGGGNPLIAGILNHLAHAGPPPQGMVHNMPQPFPMSPGAAEMQRNEPGGMHPSPPRVPRLERMPGAGPPMGRPKNMAPTKHSTFVKLLHDCHSWMGNSSGLDELPTIHLHVAGKNGKGSTALKLPGSGYVLEMMQDQLKYAMAKLFGIVPVLVSKPTGKKQKVCNPAFGVMNFTTEKNGPVWILGTPLFYQYQVGYDLSKKTASISFSKEKCGTCETSRGAALLQGEGVETRSGPRPPRFVSGPFREPSYDLSSGL
eukprot:TRINITY_DN9748_c0_g4_i3.p1 TRINITY_DN9748_c0_g4~~TRINITY_DN9748_c0_g4_i3.p1  ORF type:complete len:734 (-),score=109.79 TRINITY_DN9748_c0_g4_i3:49-2250(-)